VKTFLHFLRFMAGRDAPSTQVSAAEQEVLVGLARDARVVVELGCFEGATTFLLGQACPGVVHTVDPFQVGRIGISWGEQIARRHVRSLPAGKVVLHKMLSWDAADLVEGIDLLFIDADHAYESIRRDWESWLPRVRPGGHVALHDSIVAPNSRNRLGSMQFYEDVVRLDPRVRVVDEVGCMAVVRNGPGNHA
jgi:predicted O-methyltransferase YrrM